MNRSEWLIFKLENGMIFKNAKDIATIKKLDIKLYNKIYNKRNYVKNTINKENNFNCELCNYTTNNKYYYVAHEKTKKHNIRKLL